MEQRLIIRLGDIIAVATGVLIAVKYLGWQGMIAGFVGVLALLAHGLHWL